MRYSFQKLESFGAMGNQLWQMAGTIGQAEAQGVMPVFPNDWFYRQFFRFPDSFFDSNFEDCLDMGEEYFQDLSLFVPEDISGMLNPSPITSDLLNSMYDIELPEFTAVHVRRGNNVTPQYASHHPVMPLEYYEQAMDRTGGPFIVFSDSPEWCAQQSLFKDCLFGAGPPKGVDVMLLTNARPLGNQNAVLDLFAMSLCDNIIMSNSSFSWWAAWMRGLDGDPTVIYPKRWYGEPLKHIDTSVMFDRYHPLTWTAQ